MNDNAENVNGAVTEKELAEWQALCDAVRDQRSPYWQADRDRLATFAAPALIAEVRRLKNDFDTRVNALVDDETADLHAESVLLGDRARNAVARAEAAEAENARLLARVDAYRERDRFNYAFSRMVADDGPVDDNAFVEARNARDAASARLAELEGKGGAA